MRVAIIENMKISYPGQIGIALAEAGAEVSVVRAYAGEALPGLDDFDALVVLGGEQNARDDEKHPYLADLSAVMRAYGDAGKAVLGVCLGSQLLARAYDAESRIGTSPEFGWCRLEKTESGRADPLFSAIPDDFISFQWHDDTFDLPATATHLARNEATRHQAFRVGRAAYGFQFHFEANRTVVADWISDFPKVFETTRAEWLKTHPQAAEADGHLADEAGLAIARAWVAQI